MYAQGPMCTTKQLSLTTAFVKQSSQTARQFIMFGNCAQIITYAFVPTGAAAPTVGHTLAANAEFRQQCAPAGDLYMKAAAVSTCIITE